MSGVSENPVAQAGERSGHTDGERLLPSDTVAALLAWYAENRRDLPWRRTKDPYRIWISEIMLQQTRVEAVKRYYERFLNAFGDVTALANAPEEQLLKLWEGLGYYSRARNLQKAAKIIVAQYGGKMPSDIRALRALPGIGDYTAGAIASIAFGQPEPAVDGNLLRVLSRMDGCTDDITLPAVKKAWAERLRSSIPADAEETSAFTQAMIELGATVCVPNGAARCGECPFAPGCRAKAEDLTDVLPVKGEKRPRRIEEKTVLIIRDGERTALHKRPERGLLAGLYELPNTAGHLSAERVTELVRNYGFEPVRVVRAEDSKHIFTHIEWHMIAYDVRIAAEPDGFHEKSGLTLVGQRELHERYAIPSAFSAYTKYL